ncbi:hypothetical protein WJX72_001638 [[Myrmecia] bisecta]|uniref:Uncharacterized protein n=1 Tax=[Myrmecia] bisecta TaxID=41462 RepID=A0AAW1Q0K7_9CHLO
MADSVHDQVVSYFDYWPSQALAIVALTLFILLSVVHGAITVSTRTWFALIVTVTGLLEMAGGWRGAVCVKRGHTAA